MKDDKFFLDDDERSLSGFPLDDAIPIAAWASLPVTSRSACYLADILAAIGDIERLLASDAAAHLRWIKPKLEELSAASDRLLEDLAC